MVIYICERLLIILFPTLRTAPGRWHILNKYLFIKSWKVTSDFKCQSKLSIKLFLLLQFSSLVSLSNPKPLGFFRSWLKFFLLNKASSEWFSSGYSPFFWTLVNSCCLFHVSGTQSYFFFLISSALRLPQRLDYMPLENKKLVRNFCFAFSIENVATAW